MISGLLSRTFKRESEDAHARMCDANWWTLKATLLVVVIPNVVVWSMAKVSGQPRPFLDVDYFMVLAAIVVLGRPISVLVLTVATIPDVMAVTLPVFNLGNMGSKWEIMLLAMTHWPVTKVLAMCVALISVEIVLVYLSGRPPSSWNPRRRIAIGALIGACVLFIVDFGVLRGGRGVRPDGGGHDLRIACTRWGREILYWFTSNSNNASAGASASMVQPGSSATWRYFAERDLVSIGIAMDKLHAPQEQRQNILLILAESLGCLKTDPFRNDLFEPLRQLTNRYEITVGEVPFVGITFQGELRELAWRVPSRPDFDSSEFNFLPEVLRRNGYRTLAIHGFSSSFFERYRWYPQSGFETCRFIDFFLTNRHDWKLQGMLFAGASDRVTIDEVSKELITASRSGEPLFLHYMTLSGHYPVDLNYARTCPNERSDAAGLNEEVIAMERIHTDLIDQVARLAKMPDLSPTDIILVGDHPPPFIRASSRDAYLTDMVPYIILRDRRTIPMSPMGSGSPTASD